MNLNDKQIHMLKYCADSIYVNSHYITEVILEIRDGKRKLHAEELERVLDTFYNMSMQITRSTKIIHNNLKDDSMNIQKEIK